jgi:hypothetical protein
MHSWKQEQVAPTIASWAENQVLSGGRTEGTGDKC